MRAAVTRRWIRNLAPPLLVAGTLAACAAAPDDSWPGVLRLIDPDPGELFEPGTVLAGDGRVRDPEALAAACRRRWKVDLDHDVRSSVLSPAGRVTEWPVATVPPSAVLELSYAWLGAEDGAMTFEVRVRQSSGATLSVFAATFRNAVAQATSTYPSHVSMFSGVEAFRHGVRTPLSPPSSLELIAERLRREGFLTVAVTGGAFLHPRLGLPRGFDRFSYWPSRKEDTAELETGIEKSLRLLQQGAERPLFLFFHTYEVHHPYLLREPYYSSFLETADAPPITDVDMGRSRRFQPEHGFLREPFQIVINSDDPARTSQRSAAAEVSIARAAYDAGIAFTDAHLTRLLAAAEKLTPERPPLVIVTSDHGESLGEHDQVGHGHLFDDNLLVPLVVALSDRAHAGRWVEQQVRSIDILPTILDDLDLPVPDDIDGRSLLPLLRGDGGARSRPAWS